MNLIWSTYSKSLLATESIAFLFHLIYDMMMLLCIKIQKKWKQFKAVFGILPEMNETPFKIIFWINQTNIYTTTWRYRCCQLHRPAHLNTNAKRFISWRQIRHICLTLEIFWKCFRFRNVKRKYIRKIGIRIPKYTA